MVFLVLFFLNSLSLELLAICNYDRKKKNKFSNLETMFLPHLPALLCHAKNETNTKPALQFSAIYKMKM